MNNNNYHNFESSPMDCCETTAGFNQTASIKNIRPNTLLIYALNDPGVDELFNDVANKKLLSERGVYSVPVTTFLLAMNPPVRPMNIETLEQSLTRPEIGVCQSDIDELKGIQNTDEVVKHSDLQLLRKHSKWQEIEAFRRQFIDDFSKGHLSDCRRIIVFLHGNIVDDDSVTTSCFGTVPSVFEERLFLWQNVQTLSDAISTFLNKNLWKYDVDKVINIDFATCADFSSKQLYREFQKTLSVADDDFDIKVFYHASLRRLIINSSGNSIDGFFILFSDLESCYLPVKYDDFTGYFSYPFHTAYNKSLGFFSGECDQLIKSEISGYFGLYSVIKHFVLNKEKTPSLRPLTADISLFPFWDQVKDKPGEIKKYLVNASNHPEALYSFLQIQDNNGRNLLSHLATVQGEECMSELLDQLIAGGVRPDQQDHDGRTPLYWAANDGCVKNALQLLMSLKSRRICTSEQLIAMVNKKNIRGMPAIGKAIFHGHVEMVRLLLNQKATLDWQDNDGHTPLILACMSGNQAMGDLILGKLEDRQQINQQDDAGLTALHYAFECNPGFALTLLGKGASLATKGGEDGNTPLITACQKYSDLRRVFRNLSEDSHLETALKQYNINGWWPLGVACYERKSVLVRQLLEAGAGLSEYNRYGTALQIACLAGNLESLETLLELNDQLDLDDPDPGGKPLFHLVIDSGSSDIPEMINALLLSGCDPENRDRQGNMALHYAIKARSTAACEALIHHPRVKNTINHRNADGETALQLCFDAGSEGGVRLLIESGADISLPDPDGNTTIHRCVEQGFMDCLEMLFMPAVVPAPEIEKKLRCENRLGFTAVDFAFARATNRPIIKQFIQNKLKKIV